MRSAIIACGSREWTDSKLIVERLSNYPRDTIVIHGAARGADALCHRAALQLHMYPVPIPYFGDYGKAGGHMRNHLMLKLLLDFQAAGRETSVYETSVEAFDLGSPGTSNMRTQALKAGVPVYTTHGDGRLETQQPKLGG